jgi:uncharacterized protein
MLYQSTIPKKSSADAAFDWEQLYDLGLKHIQRLANRVWTDYNIHDPGVTALELLCYALTDLSYRASLPIEDLLATPIDNDENMQDQFFSASRILPSRPLTVLDYRKLLIDVPAVHNAWLQAVDLKYFADPVTVEFGTRQLRRTKPDLPGVTEVRIAGLYDVIIEYSAEVTTDVQKDEIKQKIRQLLHRHRNLCQDFRDIREIDTQSFIVCSELQLTPEADPARIKAEILFQVQQYLAPPVQRYSLSQMLARQHPDGTPYTADQIFDGPFLNRGFIDDGELAQSELRQEIRLSDIISIIMDIPGVEAVRDILLQPLESLPLANKWLVQVDSGKKAILTDFHPGQSSPAGLSRLVMYKRQMPVMPDQEKVANYLKELQQSFEANLDTPARNPFAIPLGEFRQPESYYSFQNHFPAIYGLSKYGLNSAADAKRQALAYQLKAYLLFFDQLLANYLAQLGQVRELFSLNPDQLRTYFYQEVENFTQIYETSSIVSILETKVEDPSVHVPRRHRFLDHLIARFAERFHDYAAIMSEVLQASTETVIAHKCAFLREYDRLSLDRPLAYNYSFKQAGELWDTDNVSGLEKRLARLLGLSNCNRRDLSATTDGESEGMYLIENILLLPEDPTDPFLPIPNNPDLLDCAADDPYTCRLHIILPAYAGRFRTMAFRRFAETIIRSEVPAHLLPKICWISQEKMATVAKTYRDWILLKAGVEPDSRQTKLQAFFEELCSVHNVYESQLLKECQAGEEEPQLFILGQTALGSLPEDGS